MRQRLRHGRAALGQRARARDRRHHDHGLRLREDRRRGDEARRRRLPAEAVRQRRARAGRRARPRRRSRCGASLARLREQVASAYRFESIIGKSAGDAACLRRRSARSRTRDSTVLVRGESGTGKELVAHAIHYNSPRRRRAVRQGELRRDLARAPRERALRPREGRLHRRRRDAREGKFEIGATAARSSSTRSATCRSRRRRSSCACCRRRELERVGGNRTIKVDVRVHRGDEPGPRGQGARAAASARTSTTG